MLDFPRFVLQKKENSIKGLRLNDLTEKKLGTKSFEKKSARLSAGNKSFQTYFFYYFFFQFCRSAQVVNKKEGKIKVNRERCDKGTIGPHSTLILGTRKNSVLRKQCIVGYYRGTSKNHVSAKFLHTLYTIKLVYIEFLVLIKNRVSAKFVLEEAVYNKVLLY